MSSLDLTLHPFLTPGVRLQTDPVRGDPVLLFPEGLLVLNETAHEIVRRCDGRTSIAGLLSQLSGEFDADEDVLRRDLLENLEQLRQRNLLSFFPK